MKAIIKRIWDALVDQRIALLFGGINLGFVIPSAAEGMLVTAAVSLAVGVLAVWSTWGNLGEAIEFRQYIYIKASGEDE